MIWIMANGVLAMEEPRQTEKDARMDVQIDSVVLERLIEEVRNDDLEVSRSYDRVHNRHNR